MAGVATNLDPSGVALFDVEHMTGTIDFAGADTLAKGTILAVDTSGGSAASPEFIIFNPAGAGDALVPSAVLEDEVVATGASTKVIHPIVKGTVRLESLVIDGGAAITATHVLALRDKGILAKPVKDLAKYDNAL